MATYTVPSIDNLASKLGGQQQAVIPPTIASYPDGHPWEFVTDGGVFVTSTSEPVIALLGVLNYG